MQRPPSCSTKHTRPAVSKTWCMVGCIRGCASRKPRCGKKESLHSVTRSRTRSNHERALVMIVMYIAAKARSPDSSSRYLIDWGNSSRKADRAEKFTSQCDSSWAGHARSIARITRRFISGHMVRSSDAGTSKAGPAFSPAVSSFATAQQPFHRHGAAARAAAAPRRRRHLRPV